MFACAWGSWAGSGRALADVPKINGTLFRITMANRLLRTSRMLTSRHAVRDQDDCAEDAAAKQADCTYATARAYAPSRGGLSDHVYDPTPVLPLQDPEIARPGGAVTAAHKALAWRMAFDAHQVLQIHQRDFGKDLSAETRRQPCAKPGTIGGAEAGVYMWMRLPSGHPEDGRVMYGRVSRATDVRSSFHQRTGEHTSSNTMDVFHVSYRQAPLGTFLVVLVVVWSNAMTFTDAEAWAAYAEGVLVMYNGGLATDESIPGILPRYNSVFPSVPANIESTKRVLRIKLGRASQLVAAVRAYHKKHGHSTIPANETDDLYGRWFGSDYHGLRNGKRWNHPVVRSYLLRQLRAYDVTVKVDSKRNLRVACLRQAMPRWRHWWSTRGQVFPPMQYNVRKSNLPPDQRVPGNGASVILAWRDGHLPADMEQEFARHGATMSQMEEVYGKEPDRRAAKKAKERAAKKQSKLMANPPAARRKNLSKSHTKHPANKRRRKR